MGIEADELVRRLSGVIRVEGARFAVREGGLAGRRVVVCETGVGRQAASMATEHLWLGHRPRWVLSMGFAGGVDPSVATGDLMLATAVGDGAGDWIACPPPPELDGLPSRRPLHRGRLVTLDRVVGAPEEKAQLGAAHAALAVDMETYAVAAACRAAGASFLALRAITDDCHCRLPREIEHVARQRSRAGRWGAMAGALVRRPSTVKDFWHLKERAYQAAEYLADLIVGLAPRLP